MLFEQRRSTDGGGDRLVEPPDQMDHEVEHYANGELDPQSPRTARQTAAARSITYR
jgi:hypothetical protein